MPMTPKALRSIGFAVSKIAPYRCLSPKCRKLGANNPEFEKRIHYIHSPLDKCSCCGENTFWLRLAIIHLILPEKRGIIIGKEYTQVGVTPTGERLDFLCDKSYKGYRENAKSPNQPQHYTGDPNHATCYECLKRWTKEQHPLGNIIVEGF